MLTRKVERRRRRQGFCIGQQYLRCQSADEYIFDSNYNCSLSDIKMSSSMQMRGSFSIIGAFLVSLGVGFMYLWGIITTWATSYFRLFPLNGNITQQTTDITFPLMFLGQAIAMPFAARFAGKSSARVNCMIAGAIFSALLYMSSYAQNFGTFAGLFGLCCGMAVGVIYIVPIIHCFRFFPNKRHIVSAVIISASGIGALIFAYTGLGIINPDNEGIMEGERYYSRQISNRFPVFVRTLSGMMLAFVCGGGLLLFDYPQGVVDPSTDKGKQKKQPAKANTIAELMNLEFSLREEELLEETKNPFGSMNYEMNFINRGQGIRGRYDDTNEDIDFWPSINQRESSKYVPPNEFDQKSQHGTEAPVQKYHNTDQCPRVRDAPKQKIFWVLFFCISFGTNLSLLVSGNYRTYAKGNINSDNYLTMIGAVGALVCGFSRFFWGLLLEKVSIKALLSLLLIVNSFLCFTMTYVVKIREIYFLYVVLTFAIYGGHLGIYPIVTSKIFGVRYSGQIYGFMFYAYTFSNFIQFFLINSVQSRFGFFVVFSLSGAMSIIALLTINKLQYSHDWSDRIRQHNERKRIMAR